MRKNYALHILTSLLLTITFSGTSQTFQNGVYVLNEGGAGSNNASVSFVDPVAAELSNNIFSVVNPGAGPLGDTAQSMGFDGDNIYIVLNISNAIKIVQKGTFEIQATIESGLQNPRYITFANGKGYITNWGSGTDPNDDYLAILDLQTNTVTGTIPLAEGIERIVYVNNKLYVAHQGGYGFGNTVSVINPENDQVETTITVADVPNRMVERDGFLYVMCGGKPSWAPAPSDGALVKIDLSDNSVASTTAFPGLNPANLQIAGTDIYFSSGAKVYKAPFADPAGFIEILSLEPQGTYGIYGMDLIDDRLFIADAADYVSPGTAYVYSTTGTLQNAYTVGVIPNGFYKAEEMLGVSGFSDPYFAIYPNPAADRFYVNVPTDTQITLFDYSGRILLQKRYEQSGVDVSALPSGAYIIRITNGKNTATQKLIVR